MKSKLFASALILIISMNVAEAGGNRTFRMNPKLTQKDYVSGKIILKIKPQYRSACSRSSVILPTLNAKLAVLETGYITRKFPDHNPPKHVFNARGQKLTDLTLIYELKFRNNLPLEKAINLLLQDDAVEYAEPEYIMQLLYTPNDPLITNQYQLTNIQAYAGWDISKGDSTIVIGITDTGTDLDHPDLVNSVKYNYADPINGIDDDNDGYIDNFMGWDLGDNDNDPSISLQHGSFVAGCSSATPDNATGIAGSGFFCKYLPIKIAAGNVLTKAYDGIVYAADHGCHIINCSWGSFGGGQFGQDIINYATINQGKLVIGAAGNSFNLDPFYPASYKYVLSVTATDSADQKWANSSFGCTVDVSAPGYQVYSTIWDDTYSFSSGTSFAAPIVAGLAGIVMWHFPSLNPLQVAEQLRATSDDIDGVPANAPYVHHLGKGRVNLFRALTETTAKSVRMEDINISDNNDNAFAANDTLSITGIITNWLNPVSNLTLTLTCNSPDVNILDGTVVIPSMSTLAVTDNIADPFLAEIGPNVPQNAQVEFTITYSDGAGYSDFQCFMLVLNVDYINVLINDVGTSITSRGRIGYNAPNQSQGIGFTYNGGGTALFESSLLIGDSPSRVSDQMFGNPVTVNDTDFTSIENVRLLNPTVLSDFDLYSTFNDDGAAGNKLDVKVTQRTFAWSTPADAKYIIVYYTFTNNGSSPLSNFYSGIYADWDIGAVTNNRAGTDILLKLGYAWEDAANGIYCGVRVLGFSPFNIYAIDNNGSAGSLGIYDGFTKAEKYNSMSMPRTTAGTAGGGGDVSVMTGSGPYTLNAGDSVKVGFALLAADSLTALQEAAQAADNMFGAFIGMEEPSVFSFTFNGAYPNPFNDAAVIEFELMNADNVRLDILNDAGMLVKNMVHRKLNPGKHQLHLNSREFSSGAYILKLTVGDKSESKIFVVAE